MYFLLFGFWVLLNGKWTTEIAIVGVIVCAALYAFMCMFMDYSPKQEWKIAKRFFKIARYFFYLLVRGVRVDGSDLSAKEDGIINEVLNIDMKYLITFSLIGLFIIFIAAKKLRDIRKKKAATTNEGGVETDDNNP